MNAQVNDRKSLGAACLDVTHRLRGVTQRLHEETQVNAIESAAVKVGLSAGVSLWVLFRTRNLPREELGIARPPIWISALFVIAYLGWMLASDAAIHWRGP